MTCSSCERSATTGALSGAEISVAIRLGGQAAQERLHLAHDVGQVDEHRRDRPATAEGEQLAGERRAARHRALELGQLGVDRTAAGGLALDERAQHLDRGEQVVEVVCHAAGKAAERLHALGVGQLVGKPLALGDVDDDGEQERPSVNLARPAVDLDVAQRAALEPVHELEGGALLVARALHLAVDQLGRQLVEVGDLEPGQLVHRVAVELRRGRVGVNDGAASRIDEQLDRPVAGEHAGELLLQRGDAPSQPAAPSPLGSVAPAVHRARRPPLRHGVWVVGYLAGRGVRASVAVSKVCPLASMAHSRSRSPSIAMYTKWATCDGEGAVLGAGRQASGAAPPAPGDEIHGAARQVQPLVVVLVAGDDERHAVACERRHEGAPGRQVRPALARPERRAVDHGDDPRRPGGGQVRVEPAGLGRHQHLAVEHDHVQIAPVERVPALAPGVAAVLGQREGLAERRRVGGLVIVVAAGRKERRAAHDRRVDREQVALELSACRSG